MNLKVKRIKKLKLKGFYSPELYDKKAEVGTNNIKKLYGK